MLLQLVIALTGNYAYFNFLTFVLCLFLIDDDSWSKLLKAGFRKRQFLFKSLQQKRSQIIASFASGVIISLFSIAQLLSFSVGLPAPVAGLVDSFGRFGCSGLAPRAPAGRARKDR